MWPLSWPRKILPSNVSRSAGRIPIEVEPIARVLPMLSVPHLDREFDYLVSAEQSDDAQPVVRVRVRFHGRLVDAFVLERRNDTDHTGKLGWLDRVVSPEPVLTPEIRRLVDAVAARYAGTRPDVLRLAVPAAARQSRAGNRDDRGQARCRAGRSAGWEAYGRGEQFLARWASHAPPGPSGRRCRASCGRTDSPRRPRKPYGRGAGCSLIVPDQRDLDALWQAATARIDEHSVVALSAGLGPAARYRRWLAALRGRARVW